MVGAAGTAGVQVNGRDWAHAAAAAKNQSRLPAQRFTCIQHTTFKDQRGLHWVVAVDHPSRIGKYEIEEFLGGGMSHVYRAKDTVLGRRVAVKVLTRAATSDTESKARFLMEARVASNITHENIISVFDFGEEDGQPFIVMEFLEGESLRAAIKNGHLGDFPWRMRVALQAGRAVDFIHSKKIIHRDIKPENINIDRSGKIKLMDFGIAKAENVQLTRTGFTLGTPYYMAPEQVLGRPLTPQADVYAYGLLLYELITENKAMSGESVEQIFEKILYQPVDLSKLDAMGIPPAVISLIGRCVAKQPAQRPRSVGEVCDEIERVLNPNYVPMARPQVQEPPVVVRAPTRSEISSEPPRMVRMLPESLRTPTGLMLLAGGAVMMGFVVLYVILMLAHVV
jgi:serine/threonine-protein kinase